MPYSRSAAPLPTSFALTELPSGAIPLSRRIVRGTSVDVFVGNLEPNIWSDHSHAAWQLTIPFGAATCDVTWWTRRGNPIHRRLLAGDVWILPPECRHAVRWRELADVIMLYVDPVEMTRHLARMRHEVQIVALADYVAVMKTVADLCVELRKFAGEPNGKSDWRVAGIGTHLAALLVEAHLARSRRSYLPSSGLATRITSEVEKYLDERKTERIAVGAMARALGISSRHLQRVFRRTTGMSPQEWVTAGKASRAKALLAAGHSPKETVSATGFSDTRHLRRVFRRCYGVAPTAFQPTTATGPS